MSNSTKIVVSERSLKPPAEGTIQLTEREIESLSELVRSPGFKVVKKILAPQLRSNIARQALSQAVDESRPIYQRGVYDGVATLIRELEYINEYRPGLAKIK